MTMCILAYNWRSSNDCKYVIKVSVKGVSMILSLTLSAIKRLLSHPSKVIVLAIFIGKMETDILTAPSWKWASAMCQRFLVFWVWQ